VDTQFVLCENNNLSTANSEIRNRFITTDGYHLSDEGMKMLASNLRRYDKDTNTTKLALGSIILDIEYDIFYYHLKVI
jgi:poly(3-hydroxyalkanoate) synthetase